MKQEGVHEAVVRKRDTIIKHTQTQTVPPEYEQAVGQMEDYLRSQGKRCTIERRYVLETLYRCVAPVDCNTLREVVCANKGNVSLTTIYNTMDLLVQLRLARRIELVSHGMVFFERTLGIAPHGYGVCDQCGNIWTLGLAQVQPSLQGQLPKGFEPTDFSIVVHGLCQKCQRALSRKKRQTRNK